MHPMMAACPSSRCSRFRSRCTRDAGEALLSDTISTFCLDCHSGEHPKGQLDLESIRGQAQ
jgi:hypothetical protein